MTAATINAQIVRREVSNLQDTRTGLSFSIADYSPTPTPITLNIVNLNASAGTFTLVIDDSTWSLVSSDPELEINAQNPVCFSGRIMVNFPAISGGNPADDAVIFLLFLVRSDGIVVV